MQPSRQSTVVKEAIYAAVLAAAFLGDFLALFLAAGFLVAFCKFAGDGN